MLSEFGRRPVIGNNEGSFGDDLEKELGLLFREQRRLEADEREKELNLYRSGSAPPTIDGSLSAIGGLFNHGIDVHSGGGSGFTDFARNKSGNGLLSDEDIRSNPAYSSYYYSKANLNPRLPPPGLSREDWRFSQRFQGGNSAIGDKRKVNRNDSGRSMFSMPPGFDQESETVKEKMQSSVEWGGDGLIGLPGLGLGTEQKSLAEMLQDDVHRATPVSLHPSRPSSRNAFDKNNLTMEPTEGELAHLRHRSTPSDPIISNSNVHRPYYAAALSRSSTPDPQRITRAPSPSLTPIGSGRSGNTEKINIISPKPVNNVPESSDLVAALSGMNLSNGLMDEENHFTSQIEQELNDHTNYHFNHMKQQTYVKKYDIGNVKNGGGPNLINGGGGLLSQYQHMGSPDSSFLNYGLTGYPMSSLSSHFESSNLPPLFENASASAMAVPMGAPNLGAATTQHNLTRMGNYMPQPPFVDPSYLQYLRALNDPNSYIDQLQRAYFGNLLSPPKSQYSVPFGAKTDFLSHQGYYGNSAYGMQNVAGSVMGPWYLDNMDNSFGLSMLEEFKCNKTKCFELFEIAGHVMEFSTDQYGSRFIQQKLETATTEEKNMVFREIFPQALTLMTDVFGNYVIQKFFEHGMASQRRELAAKLLGHVLTLSLQMYGCRVIQKAIEVVHVDQKIKMVAEIEGHVMRCVRDQNGNHVIQKCIECVPEENIHFIVSTFFDQVVTLSTHPYGCRVIQRVLEHCMDVKTQSIVMEEILGSVGMLAQDQYGNYVIQHVLEHGKPHERSTIIKELTGNIVQMSQQKFASNVVEKCLAFGNPNEFQLLVNEMLGTTDENEPLQAMMKDQFGNYVVQKVLETCSDEQRELIMSRIKVHLTALKKYTYGKHIVARVEKLVAAGERRIAAQSSHPA